MTVFLAHMVIDPTGALRPNRARRGSGLPAAAAPREATVAACHVRADCELTRTCLGRGPGRARLRIGLAARGSVDARIQFRQNWRHRGAVVSQEFAERACGRGFVARANCVGGCGIVGDEHLQPLAQ
jgi:hypothetical protein